MAGKICQKAKPPLFLSLNFRNSFTHKLHPIMVAIVNIQPKKDGTSMDFAGLPAQPHRRQDSGWHPLMPSHWSMERLSKLTTSSAMRRINLELKVFSTLSSLTGIDNNKPSRWSNQPTIPPSVRVNALSSDTDESKWTKKESEEPA